MAGMVRRLNQSTAEKTTLRDRVGVTRLFDGLEVMEPGVIRAAEWRPDFPEEAASPAALGAASAARADPSSAGRADPAAATRAGAGRDRG